jgi:hypothetical protein
MDATPAFEYALSGEILAMTRVFASDEPNVHLLATKGAPEAVADLCHLDAAQQGAIAARWRPWPSAACACWAWRADAGKAQPRHPASSPAVAAKPARFRL